MQWQRRRNTVGGRHDRRPSGSQTTTIRLRDDYDASELRQLAKRRRNNRQIRSLLALAAVYDGVSRAGAAQVGGMDRRTRRNCAHRVNAEGPDGLTDRPRPGRECLLGKAQMAELARIVETVPIRLSTASCGGGGST